MLASAFARVQRCVAEHSPILNAFWKMFTVDCGLLEHPRLYNLSSVARMLLEFSGEALDAVVKGFFEQVDLGLLQLDFGQLRAALVPVVQAKLDQFAATLNHIFRDRSALLKDWFQNSIQELTQEVITVE